MTASENAHHVVTRTRRWRGGYCEDARALLEEWPVAITINGSTYAVLLATPEDLDDFATGFAFTEGLIDSLDQIESFEIVRLDQGVEARLWLRQDKAQAVATTRRMMAGPTGCGLCGIESLEKAVRPVSPIASSAFQLRADEVIHAMASLEAHQPMNARTRAAHAAGLWQRGGGIVAVCEDVGRHNALDKLVGYALRHGVDASSCAILMTSRVSVELVQKTVRFGAPVLSAVSAPTTLAVRVANDAALTLIGVARADGFEIFTDEHARIV